MSRLDQIKARYRLADVNQRLGDFAEAKSLFEEVASLEDDPVVWLSKEELEMRKFSKEQAAVCAERLTPERKRKTLNTK